MGVLSFITGILPFLKPVLDWWNGKKANEATAAQGMKDDLQAHASDGAESVAGRESYQQQVDALKRQAEAADQGVISDQPETQHPS